MRAPVRPVAVLFVLLTTVAALTSRPVRADDDGPTQALTQSAREHFGQGVKLYDARPPDFEGALAEFRQAYAAKPSAGIKRNVALCLKGLHRYPEAMDAFDEVLAEGGETLKPEVKDAVNKTLAELDALVATLRITVELHSNSVLSRTPFQVSIDDVDLPPDRIASVPADGGSAGHRLQRAVRVLPGTHAVRARALGFQDGRQAVSVEAGTHDVPVTVVLNATALAGLGRLTVRADPTTAAIAVDGVVLATGLWSGEVGVGEHAVSVTAVGYSPHATTVSTRTGESRELAVHLVPEPMPGGPPTGPPRKKPALPRKHNDLWVGLSVQTETLNQNSVIFGDVVNTKRSFGGLSFMARYGRRLARGFGLDLLGEIGGMTTKYGTSDLNRVTVTNWVLAPEVTFRTPGTVRFFGGIALGVEGQLTDAAVLMPNLQPGSIATQEISGAGVGLMGMFEAGIETGPWPLFLRGVGFVDVHGIDGSGNSKGDPLYVGSSTVRAGLRVGVGYEF
jgi:hypothetical protein